MFDVSIIGAGGIVGCAIVRELAQRGFSVAGIEKHETTCQETSGRNSRVIHSGFHESAGTLKARLAYEGSTLLIRYAEEHRIPFLRTGMLIAIPHGSIRAGLWKEADSLWRLWRQGREQDIPFHFVLTPGGVRRLAPIEALGGIHIPSVCVIDIEQFASSLEADAKAAGAQFLYNSEVTGIAAEASSFLVMTSSGELRSRIVVNSAGLHAHEMSVMAGGPRYEIEFVRGDYYELAGGVERWNVRTLVYPATPPRSPTKGIHFGPRTDGRLFLGPSASPKMETAPKQLFLEAGRKFISSIRESDLEWSYAGIRPKRVAVDGRSDFTIGLDRSTPPLINLIGIDSPGLSASMAIARHVGQMVRKIL
jgi:glycerol-3-phosphate dehydrogenase